MMGGGNQDTGSVAHGFGDFMENRDKQESLEDIRKDSPKSEMGSSPPVGGQAFGGETASSRAGV